MTVRSPSPFPFERHVHDLANGLRVVVVPTPFPALVALEIVVQVGSRNEVEPGRTGFAHFFEHMMFRGTPRFATATATALLKDAGADQNAFTTDDFTCYHTTFPKEDLDRILELEADRFQNLRYEESVFRTEAGAVLGEYNKSFSDPFAKLYEAQREHAFSTHPYRHTTMGFVRDIERMPEMMDYSLEFFDRFYRPERTTVIVAGDVSPEPVLERIEELFGPWPRGDHADSIPTEPDGTGVLHHRVEHPTPTLPWVSVAFRSPSAIEEPEAVAALEVLADLGFSEDAPLVRRLVRDERRVDRLFAYAPRRIDPYLFTVFARVKDAADVGAIREAIQEECLRLRDDEIDPERLAAVLSHDRYGFAMRFGDSRSAADAVVESVALDRDPRALDEHLECKQALPAADLQRHATRVFRDDGMVVVSLGHGLDRDEPGSVAVVSTPTPLVLEEAGPLVDYCVTFPVGAIHDAGGLAGLAHLTGLMVAEAGSRTLSFDEITARHFRYASSFTVQIDKELTVFRGRAHPDHADEILAMTLDQLVQPGFDEADFERLRTRVRNDVLVGIRANDDEGLARERLYEELFAEHPYGHHTAGHGSSLGRITLDDVRRFHRTHYRRSQGTLAAAGRLPKSFLTRAETRLGQLPGGKAPTVGVPAAPSVDETRVTIIEKDTAAVAVSLGIPLDVTRTHEDFPALFLARSYLGEHRSGNGVLFQRMRELRGLNYGDYAYIEYFPEGARRFRPTPNRLRTRAAFEIWIRPVLPRHAHFALRLALHELDRLIDEGIPATAFAATRRFLRKAVPRLLAAQDERLGHALDSHLLGIPPWDQFLAGALTTLTKDAVDDAVRRHLRTDRLRIIAVAKDAEGLARDLRRDAPSPITYETPLPPEVLEEDARVAARKLDLREEDVRIIPLADVFA